jgi:prolipoprotein diacylglyceryltransferase
MLQFPVSIPLGTANIPLHGIFESAGFFLAFRYYLYLKKKQGDKISKDRRLVVLAAAATGALLGSHLLGALENVPEWSRAPFWQYLYGNKTLAGGLLGALFTVELAKLFLKEKQPTGDLFTYPMLLGIIIGRIGCFSAGVREQTFGKPSALPWAMDLGDGIHRHPVALYEILFIAALWRFIITITNKYTLQNGAQFKIAMIAYLAFRFLLDFIKPGWRFIAGLGSIQLACLAGLIYYYRYILHPSKLISDAR